MKSKLSKTLLAENSESYAFSMSKGVFTGLCISKEGKLVNAACIGKKRQNVECEELMQIDCFWLLFYYLVL